MFPVFSLVLDKDVKSEVAMLYPELYKDLLKVLHIFYIYPSACNHLGGTIRVTWHFYILFFILSFVGKASILQNVLDMGFDKYLPR